MSGYLRRLGAQAIDNGSGNRSLARPPPADTSSPHLGFELENPHPQSDTIAVDLQSAPAHEPFSSEVHRHHAAQEYAAQQHANRVESPDNSAVAADASHSTSVIADPHPSVSIRAPDVATVRRPNADAAEPSYLTSAPAASRPSASIRAPDVATVRRPNADAADESRSTSASAGPQPPVSIRAPDVSTVRRQNADAADTSHPASASAASRPSVSIRAPDVSAVHRPNADAADSSHSASAASHPPVSTRAPDASAVRQQNAERKNANQVEAGRNFAIAADTNLIASVGRRIAARKAQDAVDEAKPAQPAGSPAPAAGVRPARQESQSLFTAASHAVPAAARPPVPQQVRSHAGATPAGATTPIETARGAHARQRHSARPETNSHAAGAAETPDVHIHIGRVELTALAAPAAPRRKPPASTASPMSLDEYLRRRDGRAP
jgi:hypothetical protein